MYHSIEESGLSITVYNKLKRAGINDVRRIASFSVEKWKKAELIELITNYAVYHESGTDDIEDFGCSDDLYKRLKKLGVKKISKDMETIDLTKLTKKNLQEVLKEFGDFNT